jgi:hypothetical protein
VQPGRDLRSVAVRIDAPPEPAPRPNPVLACPGAWTVAVVAGALLAHLPGYFRSLFDSDEAVIATMGTVVARGGTLYRDVIDRKPPLAPFLYAASQVVTGSRSIEPLHLLVALELAAAALLVGVEARRVAGARAGWWAAGLLVAGAVAFRPPAAQAANFSELALLPGCAAIVAARRGTARSALAAGVALGLAVLTRQTWILGLLPAAFAAWSSGGRRWSRAAIVGAGLAATIASTASVVAFGPFWHWTFSNNSSLLALGNSRQVLFRAWLTTEPFLAGHVVMLGLLARRALRGPRRADADLWLWLAAGVVAVVAGLRFFDHYWFQVLPAAALLAGMAVPGLRAPARRTAVAVIVVTTVPFWAQAWNPTRFTRNWQPIVAVIRAHSAPTDRITVWGAVPELYWESGRVPAGAFVLTDLVVGRTAGWPDGPQRLRDAPAEARPDLLRSLESHRPALILDTSTARIRSYGHYPLEVVPQVEDFVDRYYRRIGTVQHVTVYELVRRPSAGG